MIGLNRALRRLPGNTWNQRWGCNTTMTLKDSEGETYLFRRRLIQTPWAALYLHDILARDSERAPHSHPFWFFSMVLRGGYTERVHQPSGTTLGDARTFYRGAGHGHTFPRGSGQVHVIVDVRPRTRTLILAGPRKDSWGFFVEGRGIVHWSTFLLEQNREPTGRRIPGRTS